MFKGQHRLPSSAGSFCPPCGPLQITPERAEHALRDLVFSSWRRSPCEEYPDTLKMISLIDFFLPYFPLQREQVSLTYRGTQGSQTNCPPLACIRHHQVMCMLHCSPCRLRSL